MKLQRVIITTQRTFLFGRCDWQMRYLHCVKEKKNHLSWVEMCPLAAWRLRRRALSLIR